MINLIENKRVYFALIFANLLIGALLEFAPKLISLVYFGIFVLFVFDIVRTRDMGGRAGAYALYMAGLELVYRMAGAELSYEFGKYSCIVIFLVGIIVGRRKLVSISFFFLLILLLPSLFLVSAPSSHLMRNMILFNISGPLTLVFAGIYFYKRPVIKSNYLNHLRIAFLPAFSVLIALTLSASVQEIEIVNLESSASASGGFAANQVSTVLGWFMLLGLLFKINGEKLTPIGWLDWVVISYLLLRGLLTFSRGGVLGSLLGIIAALLVLFVYYQSFRRKVIKALPSVIVGLTIIAGVVFYANQLTNNYLLYRYQGRSYLEVQTGQSFGNRHYLSGRYQIIEAELKAFEDYPLLGTGIGMAYKYRDRYYGAAASHTEFSRLLAEHGLLGIIFILMGMIAIPLMFFISQKDSWTRSFFVAFYVISMATMFHAAMRLAIPGVVFGFALMRIFPNPKTESD